MEIIYVNLKGCKGLNPKVVPPLKSLNPLRLYLQHASNQATIVGDEHIVGISSFLCKPYSQIYALCCWKNGQISTIIGIPLTWHFILPLISHSSMFKTINLPIFFCLLEMYSSFDHSMGLNLKDLVCFIIEARCTM
jgi:hypothetical protein